MPYRNPVHTLPSPAERPLTARTHSLRPSSLFPGCLLIGASAEERVKTGKLARQFFSKDGGMKI